MVVPAIPIVLVLVMTTVGMLAVLVVVVPAAWLVLILMVIGAVVKIACARMFVRLIVGRPPRVELCCCRLAGIFTHVCGGPNNTVTRCQPRSRLNNILLLNKPNEWCADCNTLGGWIERFKILR